MNEAISEEVHTLCQRYQALALSENHTTLTVALSEEAPRVASGAAFRHGQTHTPGAVASNPA